MQSTDIKRYTETVKQDNNNKGKNIMTDTATQTTDSTSALDKAIAAAMARKAAREANGTIPAAPKPDKATKALASDDVVEASKVAAALAKKAERDAKEEARAIAKAERDAARAEKKLAAEAVKKPAHMSKVERAFCKLPAMASAESRVIFEEATTTCNPQDIAALALHLQHFLRQEATKTSAATKKVAFGVGDTVRILNCSDARFIGRLAEVTQMHRIRCHAMVDGAKSECYLFLSDVEKVELAVEEDSDQDAGGLVAQLSTSEEGESNFETNVNNEVASE